MQHTLIFRSILPLILFLALAPAASASSTWYVDRVNGNDSNDCLSSQTACQTIGHAISLCFSGDTIMVAPATYTERLTIDISLKIIGSSANRTFINGEGAGTVVTISNVAAIVTLSKLTIRHGHPGGISNSGTLTINDSTIRGNTGGGIHNSGTLTLNHSTLRGNINGQGSGGAIQSSGALIINRSAISGNAAEASSYVAGGGIYLSGLGTISNSTISGNMAVGFSRSSGSGGGIANEGALTINNSTITGNTARQNNNHGCWGGGIANEGGATLVINNSTISGNSAPNCTGGGVINHYSGTFTINNSTISGNNNGGVAGAVNLQNSVVASNPDGNCWGAVTSNGYNLSSDDTCNLTGPGDMNNTDPKLGKLKNNGGPTQTIRLLKGSPAIDAGNPNGCTDDKGNLLKTDQRDWARPGKYDTGACDIGAFERQHD